MDYGAALWKPVLRKLFPNKAINRVDVASHLEVIYEARNRITHHKAVIDGRLDRLMESIEYITFNFGAKKPGEDAILAQMTAPFTEELETQVGKRVTW